MIMAMLVMYFLGGSVGSGAILTSAGVAELQKQVLVVMDDEARAKRASAILEELRKEVTTFEKAFAKSGRQLNKLYKDPRDNGQAALDILDDLNATWESGQERALDARFALRDELSQDEWDKLFGN